MTPTHESSDSDPDGSPCAGARLPRAGLRAPASQQPNAVFVVVEVFVLVLVVALAAAAILVTSVEAGEPRTGVEPSISANVATAAPEGTR